MKGISKVSHSDPEIVCWRLALRRLEICWRYGMMMTSKNSYLIIKSYDSLMLNSWHLVIEESLLGFV